MTTYPVDLHMHTYYSDGWQSPDSVVRHAHLIGLEVIAITDHDTVRGSLEADKVAKEVGVILIPAVELSVSWVHNGRVGAVDLLGYFIDRQHSGLLTVCQEGEADLRHRLEICCTRLSEAGYAISLADALNVNSRFASPGAVIQALSNKGHAPNFHEAAPLFYHHWIQIRPPALTIAAGIATIKAAGGAAVLAHPARVDVVEGLIQADDLAVLVDMGLDGIEVYHPTADEDMHTHLKQVARQLDLAVCGGSDDHGFNGFRRMGSQPITYAMLNDLLARTP